MTIKLYHHPLSGHSHRVQLFLSLIKRRPQLVEIDLAAGTHKSSAFLQLNSFGQVPVIEDGDHVLADSNGILVYLANRYDESRKWYPSDPSAQAEIQRFLSVASGQVAAGPAAARLVNVFGATLDHDRAKELARQLLVVLDGHLSYRDWLVGEHATIADVANYTYIAHAPEGDVDLGPFENVRAWLQRIEALDGFVPMTKTSVGLAA